MTRDLNKVARELVDRAVETAAAGPSPDRGELWLWRIEDGETHWLVARDRGDAMRVMIDASMLDADNDDVVATQLDDDFVLGIRNDDSGERDRKTAREWVESEGRGYLAGTCF
jgi:hypothetical protein